jgi:hypothetical protein
MNTEGPPGGGLSNCESKGDASLKKAAAAVALRVDHRWSPLERRNRPRNQQEE